MFIKSPQEKLETIELLLANLREDIKGSDWNFAQIDLSQIIRLADGLKDECRILASA